MKRKVTEVIKKYIDKEFHLEKPKSAELGHYATPIAFSLAKELRRPPIIIAQELASKLQNEPVFESVNAINGYINFKLSLDFMDNYASHFLHNPNDFAKGKKDGSILIEFVSANPTGPLHIGHARGAVVGDALCRIGSHLGYKITSEYYVNDAGNQVDLLGLSIFLAGRENILKLNVEFPEQYYRGEYIVDLAHKAAVKFGKNIFGDEKNIVDLSLWGKDEMMELIRQNLNAAKISFDSFISEKSLYPKWEESFEKLQSKCKTYEKDGKVWIKSQEFGDEKDRVVIREDNRPTYLAGDIVYHDCKFSRDFDRYINIWGADHHGYIARVKAAINFMGYDESKLEVILAQMVSLLKGGEPYKMSKRAGNFILMSEVIDEIGSDALRFMFLSKKSDTHLEFDIDELKKDDNSNPVYYVNYAHARINQLFAKCGKRIDDVANVKLTNLNESAQNLLFNALLLPEVLEDAFETRQLQKVTDYLKSLAAVLHKFYNENRVLGSEFEDRYLKLLSIVSLSLRTGLNLIGVNAKEKM
ncbi:MAG: arginine--tRNA ligase [Campylobacteraceae bacterium]|jgi:arginyl-tRNA synthetase|nr:arginine--tRNA ligase [Campylobacteraceae bacterium]